MTKPVRIAHVIYRLATGGMENGLVNLVNRMDPCFEHHIISLTDATGFRDRITNPSVKVEVLNKKPGKDLLCYWRLFKVFRKVRPDIVHTRNFGTLDSGLIARLSGVSVILHSEHGWDVGDLHGSNKRYQRLRRWMSRLFVKYLSVSKDLQSWLENTVQIPKNKLVHICNGVDTQRYVPGTRGAGDPLIVGFVGRLEAVKNPALLLKALTICNKNRGSGKAVLLKIAGSGSMVQELEQLVKEWRLENSVEFLGEQRDIPTVMQSFDVFVLPSHNEGISNTILEAMASGLPVLASRVGGNVELVNHAENGFLFESDDEHALADVLCRYADDEELRSKHGAASRQRAEKYFSLNTMVGAYEELYRSCISLA